MTTTATEITREHFQRHEVKSTILRYCQDGDAFRALNGDDGWYKRGAQAGEVSLTTPQDYDSITTKHRTLYATLDFLEPSVKKISEKWDEKKGAPEKPIGTLQNCLAYSPSVDIDSIKGPNGEDITSSPEIKAAVEAAGQFFVDYLREHGITKSVHCLYSGGGVYVHLHHALFRAAPEWSPDEREQAYRSLTMAFNSLLGEISRSFFEAHPEHEGHVKFDALNNQKRKFKTIFSLHKRLPFAVIPLDPEHIEIDFEKARLPLPPEVLAEGEQWYQTFDPEELPKPQELLKPFMEQAEVELRQRKARTGSYEISQQAEPLPIKSWPPCMRNVLEKIKPGYGPHRALAVLASFFYQVGWLEDEAFKLWKPLADKVDVEIRIFNCWYGTMSCPNCATIQKTSSGYPSVGFGGLGYCKQDEHCKGCVWPGDYPLQKIINESRDSTEPSYRLISKDDPVSSIGVCPKTGAVKKVVEIEAGDGPPKRFLAWVSDCPVHIYTETRANDETEFTFVGTGAMDERQVKFTLPATDLAEPRKFKAALLNAFGAKNKLGTLNFEMVQEMTQNTQVMRRIEVTTWDGNIPLLPGVGLAGDVEYRLSAMTPVEVYEGDIEAAKDCLRRFLGIHRYAPILMAAILGAPAFARWHANERFGVALWGLTGSLKTSVAQAGLSVYGTGYLDDESILKHGKAGATQVATLEVFANAGILPQLLDNVKTVDEKDSLQYIATIQAVIEGREKQRGKKDGGLRDSRSFNCTPIITGEIRPEEASTTARVLNLTWTRPEDLTGLSYIQENVQAMPVIGYQWLRFLANTDLNLVDGFNEARSRKMTEFSGKRYTNPGRLATIYTLLRSAWDLLCQSPFEDLFKEFKPAFISSLDEAIEEQGRTVTEETEVEKFLSGLKELLASNPGLIQSQNGTTIYGRVIGKWVEEGLFLLPSEALAELHKIGVFTQKPTVDSLTKALHAAGKLVIDLDGKHLKAARRVNGTKLRGWLLSLETCLLLSPVSGDTKTSSDIPDVPTNPTVPTENEREISEENRGSSGGKKKQNQESGGDSGDSGDKIGNNRITDIDLIVSKGVPTSVPTDQNNGDISIKAQREAGVLEAQSREAHFRKKAEQLGAPPAAPIGFDPPTKARLWDSIRLKLRKYQRVNKATGQRGLGDSDLTDEERSLLVSNDWIKETTEHGITIWWAPTKTMRALGISVPEASA